MEWFKIKKTKKKETSKLFENSQHNSYKWLLEHFLNEFIAYLRRNDNQELEKVKRWETVMAPKLIWRSCRKLRYYFI